ncbi:response regulator [Pseudonocardia sp. GCM10023141]|uniref:response regulator n=1 Tax=Pseudonocardia sp. GCM10023141 TaxID=3252653 RepID=UPI003623A0F8
MDGDPVRLLVVDDQPAFRAVVARVLARLPGFELAGEAGSGEEAVTAAGVLRPDMVLMDVHLPGIDGIEAAAGVVRIAPGTVVVLCSTYDIDDLAVPAGASGVAGYLNKEALSTDALRELWEQLGPTVATT